MVFQTWFRIITTHFWIIVELMEGQDRGIIRNLLSVRYNRYIVNRALDLYMEKILCFTIFGTIFLMQPFIVYGSISLSPFVYLCLTDVIYLQFQLCFFDHFWPFCLCSLSCHYGKVVFYLYQVRYCYAHHFMIYRHFLWTFWEQKSSFCYYFEGNHMEEEGEGGAIGETKS